MDEQEAITLTMRVENAAAVAPGSEKDTCGDCGEDVWISPATRVEIDRGAYPEAIRCLTCAIEEDA